VFTTAIVLAGAGVVGVLMVKHWHSIRDHVEGWAFLLTAETITIRATDKLPTSRSGVAESGELLDVIVQLTIVAHDRKRSVIAARGKLGFNLLRVDNTGELALKAQGWRFVELLLPRVVLAYAPERTPERRLSVRGNYDDIYLEMDAR
jgi:hypothetical protein